jgi:hypothetical protein
LHGDGIGERRAGVYRNRTEVHRGDEPTKEGGQKQAQESRIWRLGFTKGPGLKALITTNFHLSVGLLRPANSRPCAVRFILFYFSANDQELWLFIKKRKNDPIYRKIRSKIVQHLKPTSGLLPKIETTTTTTTQQEKPQRHPQPNSVSSANANTESGLD